MNQIMSLWGKPLLLEMELYFGCPVRKRIHVRKKPDGKDTAALNDKLSVSFRPVITQSCAMRKVERDNPPVMDMPIVKPERYYPHRLTLDYRRGEWLAESGHAAATT